MISVHPKSLVADQPGATRIGATIRHGWWTREILWFEFPERSEISLEHQGNAWLTALLPLAFDRGESLEISAPVDRELLANAEKLQAVWSRWFPDRKPVKIFAEPSNPSPAVKRRTGCFFTSGVDSLYTVLHRESLGDSASKVDDLIYVWGYDIPLTKPEAMRGKMAALRRIAKVLDKNLITLASNLRQTRLGKLDWGLRAYGSALGAVGLLLGERCDHFLVSSGHAGDPQVPWGSHLLTVPLMGGGGVSFSDYGDQATRFEKTRFIADFPAALASLHVCWGGRDEMNCGQCEKCLRTLTALELLGKLSQATSFPPGSFSTAKLAGLRVSNSLLRSLHEELINAAHELGRPEIARILESNLVDNHNV